MDDVLEFRECKSPYYNSLNRQSPSLQRNISENNTRKSLPPLESSKSFDSSLNSTTRSVSQLESPRPKDLATELFNASVLNKKKSPDKLVSIGQSIVSHVNIRDLETPVTIDIISESGRHSRQSLDPLTSRESNSRYSSRPSSSVKENLIKKTSLKPKSSQEEKMSNIIENKPISQKSDQLDTIKESLTEALRINVKKLDLNSNSKFLIENKSKQVTSILKKPQNPITKQPIKPPDNLKINTKKSIIENNKPNRSLSTDKKTTLKNSKITSLNNVSKTEPVKIESSRIESKKVHISPIETPSDIFAESFQSTLTNVTCPSRSTLCPSGDIRLEINSSRMNLNEKPLSAKSMTIIGEPKEPVISTMFENYPQPFKAPNFEKQKNNQPKPKSSSYQKKPQKNQIQKVKSAPSKKLPVQNTKKEKNKILISLSNQDIDLNLQKEIDESMFNEYDSAFDYDSDGRASMSSKNTINYLSDNEKEISEIKLDEPISGSLKSKAAQIALNTQPEKKSEIEDENSKEILSSRINKNFVKSFEDRVFAIYTKFDNLLMQQEDNQEKIDLLNCQKAQFSEEIAKELKENINFDEDENNSNYKRLKDLYDMVKQNSDEKRVVEKPPIASRTEKKDGVLNRINSIKSNADIREVFSLVNNDAGKNSFKSIGTNNNTADLTIVPRLSRTFKLPVNFSDKINTLIVSLPKNERNEDNEEDSNIDENFMINSKIKLNNVNKLDSLGNESRHSSESFDSNSLSYHYDLKYKNDRSKSPISLQIESENDFQFRWKRGNLLGKGAFGSVYQAMLNTGEIIAVKQIEMEESDPVKARKEYDSVREEVKILRELEHINIVQFMGTMLVGNVVNIFMELIPGGTIETLLKTFGPFDEDLFKIFTNQIVEGVCYLHSRNVVHRDIKGRNIMLMSSGIVKLIDFGCAKRLRKNQSSNSIKQLLKSLKGTPYWMSPEVIRETGHGSKADIWSLGATVYEMAVGIPPWGELSPISAIYAIGSGETQPPELPEKNSEDARDFVRKCLTRDPEKRPSAADLLDHVFLRLNSH